MELYLRQFDVEKHEMASVMGTCAGLVGPKSENIKKVLVFKAFVKGSRVPRVDSENEQGSGPDRPGGVLGSFWGYFGVTLGSFWGLWGYFGYMKVTSESFWPVFTKYTFFQYILMTL